MPRLALAAAVCLASTAALARAEDRPVPEFDAVYVASGIRATVEIGPRRPVRVEADDDVLALFEMTVEDRTLHLGFKPNARWSGDRSVTVTIQTPELKAVGASGGSRVRATFSRGGESGIEASGGSEVRARGIDAARFSLHGSGGSIFHLQGAADALELRLSGGSQVHGSDLSVKDIDVQASGGSGGEIRANGRIRGNLSGGSELHVRGGARAKVATSGGSSIDVDD